MQYVLPQFLLSSFVGWVADLHITWLKNYLIHIFIKQYKVDLREAEIETPEAYATFNNFFIRKLKPHLRPIADGADTIISPVDGAVAQIGQINQNQLLQAKGCYFSLESLLGGDSASAAYFQQGSFATLYLAPNNYHRVHMPLTGKLRKTMYVPGKLFSVNRTTTDLLPNLYSRNERFICIFDTSAGPMAVILVGAMIVGSMQTVWQSAPIRGTHVGTETYQGNLELIKGAELGHFKMGSTIILLFAKQNVIWTSSLQTGNTIQLGQKLGNINPARKLSVNSI